MQSFVRGVLAAGCAAVVLSLGVGGASAATIGFTNQDNLNHSAGGTGPTPNLSAFFTSTPDGLVVFAPDNGWAPITDGRAGFNTSITTGKTFSIVGNSTSAGGWTDGNKIPAGVALSFNAQFTFTATGNNAANYLTVPGNTTNAAARGIGVTHQNDANGVDDLDGDARQDGLSFTAVTLSNVLFSGTPTESDYTLSGGSVSGFGTRVFRSNNFVEADSRMLFTNLTTGDTIGFGTGSTGSIASGQLIENNFGTGGTPSYVFPRQTGPYTLVTTLGGSALKGVGMEYDVAYEINSVPEPASAALTFVGLAAIGLRRRRRC